MYVSAVSANEFTGNSHKRGRVDEIIGYNDNELRNLAYYYADQKYNTRREKARRLFYAVPLIGGLSAGLLGKDGAKMFGKDVTGLAARAVNAVKGGGYWVFLLGIASAVGLGTRAVANHSKTADNFKNKHPLLTLGAQVGAVAAALTLLPKGAAKVYNAIKPEILEKAGKGVGQVAEHINKLKVPDFISSFGQEISKRTPKVVKDSGKILTAYAPDITLIAAILASLKSFTGSMVDYNNAYVRLKDKQLKLAQARINELKSRHEGF